MLHRNKKQNDINEGKWIGVGGKTEYGESAGECLEREVKEETGLTLKNYVFHGVIYFINDEADDEEMYLYSSEIDEEQASEIDFDCKEGTLKFIKKSEVMDLPLWEGDRVFLKDLLDGKKRISYELVYEKGKLVKAEKVAVKNVIFDLDGTVADSGEGIMKCAAYSLEAFGFECRDYRELSFFVGPPLLYTYTRRYGVSEEQARKMIAKYRERYHPVGVYECSLYPGIKECIEELKAKGYNIALASSKPEAMCKKMLDHLGVLELFDEVTGSTPDGSIDTKTEVLNELFRRCVKKDTRYKGEAVLIGDTGFDMFGARNVGISSIGVSFGYGDMDEMEKLGAIAIADSAEELKDMIINA